MKALIVYDSYFGNTEKIAQAIADGLKSRATATRVGDADPDSLQDVDLLIVGSPTRAFKATPPVIQFINKIHRKGLHGIRVSAFDTRISAEDTDSKFLKKMIKLFGYAAEPLAKKLKTKGGEVAVPPEGFFVQDTEGPLKEGELERAREWANQF